jgi:hypothetical protein
MKLNLDLNRFKFVRDVQEPAILGYLVMFVAGFLLYFFMMSARASDIAALMCIVIGTFGLMLRWRAAPILVLFITTYALIDPAFLGTINFLVEGRWQPFTFDTGFSLENLLLVIGLMSYLMAHYRIHAVWERVLPDDPTIRGEVVRAVPVARPVTQILPNELQRVLIVGACAIVGCQLLWLLVTTIERRMEPHVLTHGIMRGLILLWGIGCIVVFVSSVLQYIRWNRNSPAEAAMILRDAAFHETRRETDRIERWRKWFKEKMSRRRAKG